MNRAEEAEQAAGPAKYVLPCEKKRERIAQLGRHEVQLPEQVRLVGRRQLVRHGFLVGSELAGSLRLDAHGTNIH